jgi:RNA polymerase sigma-70 factor (ECF subfamily)
LRRWAHGRLPPRARDITDTDDLVQVTLMRALSHMETFQPQHDGAFAAYLRQILLNQIRDLARRVAWHPRAVELEDGIRDPGASPLERAIGKEMVDRYESALAKLTVEQREAVVMRLEMGFSYQEIADAQGRATAGAARQVILRALARLAKEMHDHR